VKKKLFASVLLCGVTCGGTFQSGSSDGTGGASGQAGATAGHGGSGASAGSSAGGGHGGTFGIAGTGNGGSGGTAKAGAGGTGAGGSTAGTCGASCGPNCGFQCCGAECVNLGNDINNCGACGTVCPTPNPYCDNGKCGTPPCQGATCAAGTTCCCEAQCCTAGQLCCEVSQGTVGVYCTKATDKGTCPTGCAQCVCTAPSTPIATPSGERAISELKVGDLVYSVHRGQLEAVPIILINRVPVTGSHHMVEMRLSTGSVLQHNPCPRERAEGQKPGTRGFPRTDRTALATFLDAESVPDDANVRARMAADTRSGTATGRRLCRFPSGIPRAPWCSSRSDPCRSS
jgi:hypothetical protein